MVMFVLNAERGQIAMSSNELNSINPLVEQAIASMHGDKNPYRITSYLIGMFGCSSFGLMVEVKEALGLLPPNTNIDDEIANALAESYATSVETRLNRRALKSKYE